MAVLGQNRADAFEPGEVTRSAALGGRLRLADQGDTDASYAGPLARRERQHIHLVPGASRTVVHGRAADYAQRLPIEDLPRREETRPGPCQLLEVRAEDLRRESRGGRLPYLGALVTLQQVAVGHCDQLVEPDDRICHCDDCVPLAQHVLITPQIACGLQDGQGVSERCPLPSDHAADLRRSTRTGRDRGQDVVVEGPPSDAGILTEQVFGLAPREQPEIGIKEVLLYPRAELLDRGRGVVLHELAVAGRTAENSVQAQCHFRVCHSPQRRRLTVVERTQPHVQCHPAAQCPGPREQLGHHAHRGTAQNEPATWSPPQLRIVVQVLEKRRDLRGMAKEVGQLVNDQERSRPG